MTRKTAYRHPVSHHVRAGVQVHDYERGKGKPKPPARSESLRTKASQGSKYNVAFYFSDGTREAYDVNGGTLTGAVGEALPRIQRPMVPVHAQVRRLGR